MADAPSKPRLRVGDTLLANGVLTESELEVALGEAFSAWPEWR